MYCYRITNLINGKKYIGITIDYQRRWKEHISRKESLISKSIKKNGVELNPNGNVMTYIDTIYKEFGITKQGAKRRWDKIRERIKNECL